MVLGLTAGQGIGLGLSALGTLGGLFDDSQDNLAIANLLEQRRANRAREDLGRQQIELATAPVTSGTGTRSEFIPGRGFVTTLSPVERTIAQGNLQRRQRETATEEPRRREESRLAAGRRLETGALADASIRGFDDPSRRTERSVLGSLRLQNRRQNEDVLGELANELARRLVATGDIGASSALQSTLQGIASSNRSGAPSSVDAAQAFQSLEDPSQDANLISLLTNLARPDLSAAPTLPIPGDQRTAALQRIQPQAFGVGISSIRPSILSGIQPSNLPNALNAAASAVFGIDQQNQAQRERQQLISLLTGRQLGNQTSLPDEAF